MLSKKEYIEYKRSVRKVLRPIMEETLSENPYIEEVDTDFEVEEIVHSMIEAFNKGCEMYLLPKVDV